LIYITQKYDRIDVRDLNDVYYLNYEGSREESNLWVYDIDSKDMVWNLEFDDLVLNAKFTNKHVIVDHRDYLTLHDVDTGKLISTIDIPNNGFVSTKIRVKDDYIIVFTALDGLIMIKEK
jgi:outer membrane protein assembly factor BamB